MRRIVLLTLALLLTLPGAALAAKHSRANRGIPSGAPPAALAPEPTLAKPSGWPFPERFSRTSGTGRLSAGASYWTDFVYDDHGALGPGEQTSPATLAPARGSYSYPTPAAKANGADIFRTAVGLTRKATYWRVDWTTLADPSVPIAEWAIDRDHNPQTGVAAWPAGAGVSSAGIDTGLVVSSRGAWLIDASSGKTTDVVASGGKLTVDKDARSFVVKIPRRLLAPSGTWTIRLAAGVAGADGKSFAPVDTSHGAAPGQPAVYNVAYRSDEQEGALVCPPGAPAPPADQHVPVFECGNFWNENDQAQTLATGDVSKYSGQLDWRALARKRSTPDPLVKGYSVRWYVSRLNLGQGVVHDSGNGTGDLKPNFLSPVQPYTVWIPQSYRPGHKTPLTWILHSLGVNHNQYTAVASTEMLEQCEYRGSICATTLGRGPDGWYHDEAEVDFWQVWHELAKSYTLDPSETVLSGYSMGGYAAYKLGFEYPDLFAHSLALEGPPACGLRVVEGAGAAGGPGRCTTDGDTTPMAGNALWLPFSGTYGFIDELVPITSGLEQVQAMEAAGDRTKFFIYPTEDHMVFSLQNDFSPLTTTLGFPRRVINPGEVRYTWYPDLQRSDYGIGPTGAYWVRDIQGRDRTPGKLASLDAKSLANPDPARTLVQTTTPFLEAHPTPALIRRQEWQLGARPAAQPKITLTLANVASLALDLRRARLRCGTIAVHSDGPVTLRLIHAPAGPRSSALPAGDSTVSVPCRRR